MRIRATALREISIFKSLAALSAMAWSVQFGYFLNSFFIWERTSQIYLYGDLSPRLSSITASMPKSLFVRISLKTVLR